MKKNKKKEKKSHPDVIHPPKEPEPTSSHKNTKAEKTAAAAAEEEMLYTQRNEKKDPPKRITQNRGQQTNRETDKKNKNTNPNTKPGTLFFLSLLPPRTTYLSDDLRLQFTPLPAPTYALQCIEYAIDVLHLLLHVDIGPLSLPRFRGGCSCSCCDVVGIFRVV